MVGWWPIKYVVNFFVFSSPRYIANALQNPLCDEYLITLQPLPHNLIDLIASLLFKRLTAQRFKLLTTSIIYSSRKSSKTVKFELEVFDIIVFNIGAFVVFDKLMLSANEIIKGFFGGVLLTFFFIAIRLMFWFILLLFRLTFAGLRVKFARFGEVAQAFQQPDRNTHAQRAHVLQNG